MIFRTVIHYQGSKLEALINTTDESEIRSAVDRVLGKNAIIAVEPVGSVYSLPRFIEKVRKTFKFKG